MHPDLTRRVRLVMRWNRFVFDHGLSRLGWDLTVRRPGSVVRKARR